MCVCVCVYVKEEVIWNVDDADDDVGYFPDCPRVAVRDGSTHWVQYDNVLSSFPHAKC